MMLAKIVGAGCRYPLSFAQALQQPSIVSQSRCCVIARLKKFSEGQIHGIMPCLCLHING